MGDVAVAVMVRAPPMPGMARASRDTTQVTVTVTVAGRPGRVEGTRELVVHPSYLVAYRISGTEVQILTVRHAARLWPDRL